ncbi:MAG TPA: tyrosine-type recombinase/integrase [Candidatus Saccharimonadales bacterium]|nr:tyrosine-type recombinase/integrase [Candidatus Saccharimonadales bacterium]
MTLEPLNKILHKFIEDLKSKGRSPATILAYRADLDQLILFLSEKNKATPEQVKKEDIEGFRDWLLLQKYTAKSASRKLNAVKTFFRWLTSQKVLITDPSKDVSHPEVAITLPKFLSQLEYRALRDVARGDRRIATIIELILQTGLRISEVANLKRENLKGGEILIEAYATQPARKIRLNKAALAALQLYLQENPTESLHVFVSKNAKPLAIRNIRAAVDRYIQRSEIGKFSVNDLRTTFIVENLKRGVDLVTISQVAGHKRLSTTERYLELAGIKETGKKQDLEEL